MFRNPLFTEEQRELQGQYSCVFETALLTDNGMISELFNEVDFSALCQLTEFPLNMKLLPSTIWLFLILLSAACSADSKKTDNAVYSVEGWPGAGIPTFTAENDHVYTYSESSIEMMCLTRFVRREDMYMCIPG